MLQYCGYSESSHIYFIWCMYELIMIETILHDSVLVLTFLDVFEELRQQLNQRRFLKLLNFLRIRGRSHFVISAESQKVAVPSKSHEIASSPFELWISVSLVSHFFFAVRDASSKSQIIAALVSDYSVLISAEPEKILFAATESDEMIILFGFPGPGWSGKIFVKIVVLQVVGCPAAAAEPQEVVVVASTDVEIAIFLVFAWIRIGI